MEPKYPSTLSPGGVSQRNIEAILPAMRPFLAAPTTRTVLEISSGDGVHLAEYAKSFPDRVFVPTECDEFGVKQLNERFKGEAKDGAIKAEIRDAALLDVLEQDCWDSLRKAREEDGAPFDLVLASNVLHMMPFPEGASAIFRHLADPVFMTPHHPRFCVYGPFRSVTGFFSDSDAKFDETIKARPNGERLGLRAIEDLESIADQVGWVLREKIFMPAGNFVLIFGPRKLSPSSPTVPRSASDLR
ncbi:hypothetical protein T439DRAFT_347291 [Meredithblackwellia eburnea MCA 4105]